MTLKFNIDLPPVTKKNHGNIVTVKGKVRLLPSKQYLLYQKQCEQYMPKLAEPIDYPVTVNAKFYMPTRRRCDLVNLEQALLDILVHYGVLADDNITIVFSMDGSRALYDKDNPRTEVTITGGE